MNIELPTEQKAFIDSLVASGRFSSLDAAISEGIRLLVSQETLKQEVDLAVEQADRSEVVDHDTVFAHLRVLAAAQDAKSGQ
jgi:putative addiction module CopG family antidote